MLKKILIGLIVVILALVAFIATRPGETRVERSATIAAPADVVLERIANFHHFASWSPWHELDPNMKVAFAGPESGVGAKYHWVGNDAAGEGSMEVKELKAGEFVAVELKFIQPFESTALLTFTAKPQAENTHLTWTFVGKNGFMDKAMGLIIDMDKRLGDDFEKGLAKLKPVAEAEAKRLADEAAAKKAAEEAAAAAATVPAEGAPAAVAAPATP